MRKLSTWMLAGFALSLAGCASNATNCAGWKQISVKPDTALYLAGNDVKAGQGIASHNQFGNARGCW